LDATLRNRNNVRSVTGFLFLVQEPLDGAVELENPRVAPYLERDS
jgi:hypothetical protein